MADAQVVLVPNPEAVAGGDWQVNADGVLEPVVAAPILLPEGVLKQSETVDLAADANNLDPSGSGSLTIETVFVSVSGAADGGRVITGLIAPVLSAATAASASARVRLFNLGPGPLVLPDNDAGSDDPNRFNTSLVMGAGVGPVIVLPGNFADLLYDRAGDKWLVLAPIARDVGVSLQTTDAAVTEIYNTGDLGAGQVVKLSANIAAARAASATGRGGFEVEALFFRDGAAATALEGALQTSFTRRVPVGLKVSLTLSGNAVSVTVQGIAAETYNWRGLVTAYYSET